MNFSSLDFKKRQEWAQIVVARTLWVRSTIIEINRQYDEVKISVQTAIAMTTVQPFEPPEEFFDYVHSPESSCTSSDGDVDGRVFFKDIYDEEECGQMLSTICTLLIAQWDPIDAPAANELRRRWELLRFSPSGKAKFFEDMERDYISEDVPADLIMAFKVYWRRTGVFWLWRFAALKEAAEANIFLKTLRDGFQNDEDIDACIETWEAWEEIAYYYKKCLDMFESICLAIIQKRTPTLEQLEKQRQSWFAWARTAIGRSQNCTWIKSRQSSATGLAD